MEGFTEFLKVTGIDPALLSFGLVLGIILRYMRGMIHWVGEGWTFGAAAVLACAGAALKMAEHEPWRATGINALGLLVITLVSQKVLQGLAEKVGWLPKDNEWLNRGGTT